MPAETQMHLPRACQEGNHEMGLGCTTETCWKLWQVRRTPCRRADSLIVAAHLLPAGIAGFRFQKSRFVQWHTGCAQGGDVHHVAGTNGVVVAVLLFPLFRGGIVLGRASLKAVNSGRFPHHVAGDDGLIVAARLLLFAAANILFRGNLCESPLNIWRMRTMSHGQMASS